MIAIIFSPTGVECQKVFPIRCEYESNSLQNPSVDDVSNCSEITEGGTMLTRCSHPIVLTDNELGPDNYEESGLSYYLLDNSRSNRILFTFSRSVSLSTIQLHYYIDTESEVALPKIRISLVNNFNVLDTIPDGIRSSTIDGRDPSPELDGREIYVAGESGEFSATSATQVLMRIEDNKDIALALSEVIFCLSGEYIQY